MKTPSIFNSGYPVVSQVAIQRMQHVRLSDSYSDPQQIVALLDRLIDDFSHNLPIRVTAESIIRENTLSNDEYNNFTMLVNWVRRKVKYVADPVGQEFIKSPVNMLGEINMFGQATGDCDDHVILLGALVQSIGMPTIAVGVKINGSIGFNHVINSSFVDGRWIDADACVKDGVTGNYKERLE